MFEYFFHCRLVRSHILFYDNIMYIIFRIPQNIFLILAKGWLRTSQCFLFKNQRALFDKSCLCLDHAKQFLAFVFHFQALLALRHLQAKQDCFIRASDTHPTKFMNHWAHFPLLALEYFTLKTSYVVKHALHQVRLSRTRYSPSGCWILIWLT